MLLALLASFHVCRIDAQVRHRDWPALETRRVEHVHQIQRHATCAAERCVAARRSFPGPSCPKRSQTQRAVAKLLEAGLVKEIRAKGRAPIWRRDEQTWHTYALRLTAAGVKAIAVDETPSSQGEAERRADHLMVSVDPKPEPGSDPAAFVDRASGGVTSTLKFPRRGTKIAQVIERHRQLERTLGRRKTIFLRAEVRQKGPSWRSRAKPQRLAPAKRGGSQRW